MKTLEELAEEYLETAENLKKKIKELKRRDQGTNLAAIHKTIDTYEQMYNDAIMNYNKLKITTTNDVFRACNFAGSFFL